MPDNAGFYYLAYAAATGIYAGYAFFLITRRRRARARQQPPP
jgi:hypothetical protein